jgi:hypothetical protein
VVPRIQSGPVVVSVFRVKPLPMRVLPVMSARVGFVLVRL